MCLGLALADTFAQQGLQVLHIVVLEHPDVGATEPGSKTNGGMVKFVRDDKAAFSNESGNDGRVCGETHGGDEGILSANEHGDEGLGNNMKIIGTTSEPGSTRRDAVALDGLLNGIGATAPGLGETEVVVGGDVEGTGTGACEGTGTGACEGTGTGACEDLGMVVVERDAVEKTNGAAGNASDGMGETLVEAGFKAAGIE